jgi:hypothetical protein
MKKIILILTLTTLLFSCSKSDDGEKQLEVNKTNMAGDWLYTTVIQPDGKQIPYVNLCSTKKDYVNIIVYSKINAYFYYPDCVPYVSTCNSYYFEGNKIISCFEEFGDAKVVSLTAKTMQLEYDSNKTFGSLTGPARGLILTKK